MKLKQENAVPVGLASYDTSDIKLKNIKTTFSNYEYKENALTEEITTKREIIADLSEEVYSLKNELAVLKLNIMEGLGCYM